MYRDSTSPNRFLRFVQGAPQALAFLSDVRQLLDLERFCTNPSKPGILRIDTTYNCGEFYVTPTTYRHQLLLSKRTGKHPVLLGPTLIHITLGKKVVKIGQKIEWGCDRHKHFWSSWGYNFLSFKGMTLKLIQATILDSRKILE